jgi:hypothetical protein
MIRSILPFTRWDKSNFLPLTKRPKPSAMMGATNLTWVRRGSRQEHPRLDWRLSWLAGVVFSTVDTRVIVLRLEVGDDFGRHR